MKQNQAVNIHSGTRLVDKGNKEWGTGIVRSKDSNGLTIVWENGPAEYRPFRDFSAIEIAPINTKQIEIKMTLTPAQFAYLAGSGSDLYDWRSLKSRHIILTPGIYEFIENEADKTYYGNNFEPGEIRMIRGMLKQANLKLDNLGLRFDVQTGSFIQK